MTDEMVPGAICGGDGMHPYNCGGPGRCIHCSRRKFKGHNPADCWLCHCDVQRHGPNCLCKREPEVAAILLPKGGPDELA